jgi:hypothetical protein
VTMVNRVAPKEYTSEAVPVPPLPLLLFAAVACGGGCERLTELAAGAPSAAIEADSAMAAGLLLSPPPRLPAPSSS